jgi:hypothetical protein
MYMRTFTQQKKQKGNYLAIHLTTKICKYKRGERKGIQKDN